MEMLNGAPKPSSGYPDGAEGKGGGGSGKMLLAQAGTLGARSIGEKSVERTRMKMLLVANEHPNSAKTKKKTSHQDIKKTELISIRSLSRSSHIRIFAYHNVH